jgi:hypothetical protein
MVPQPEALGHSIWCVFPHLGSIDIHFSSYPLKTKYVEFMGKDKGHNSSHVYWQVKGWSKKSCEILSNDFGKSFWNGMMEGKKMGSYQKDFKVAMFFPLKILTSFLIWRLLELFFFFLFLFLSFSLSLFQYFSLFFFNALSLWELRDFDEKNSLQKIFSNSMGWYG